jgi:hypothetical protein
MGEIGRFVTDKLVSNLYGYSNTKNIDSVCYMSGFVLSTMKERREDGGHNE